MKESLKNKYLMAMMAHNAIWTIKYSGEKNGSNET
jgi:hypothetical protein